MITVDVEPDCSPSWHYAQPLSFEGVYRGVRDRLQPLFNSSDQIPTYLVNNVVLEDPKSVEVLRDLPGRCELGTHLHPEFIDPQKQIDDYAGKKGEANQCFLPPDIEKQKMENITHLFRKSFGFGPTAFRAGRFSAGGNTIRCLHQLGYKVDTSVTPHVCWDDATRESPVDYTLANEQPYFTLESSLVERDPGGNILEVPVSIIAERSLMSRAPLRKRAVWLRPVFSSLRSMIHVVRHLTKKYADRRILVFNMMFHNVEVMPGISPYTQTENDCRRYLTTLEMFFAYCREEKITGVSLSELYTLFRDSGGSE